MLPFTLFIIDDEQTIRDGLSMGLEEEYAVKTFKDAETALDIISHTPPDIVLLDVGLPGMNGIEALSKIKGHYPDTPVIMITAYEEIDTVISAMKKGAYDFIIKPIHMEQLEITLKNALSTIALKREIHLLQEQCIKENMPCFIGDSNAIQDVMEFIKMVAKSPDTPIIIFGETGTGKEIIASAIHYRSPNFNGPFVTLNCAAIPHDLIESELFGYEKGAFSGASASGKRGLIEEAENGTLFLDEIGDLGMEAQAKLLRFLENGEFYKVGGTKKYHIKTRIVSATNKNIEDMIEKGSFRKDLYFRLGVIKAEVPSLNDRREDVIALSKYFLDIYNSKFNKRITSLSGEVVFALKNHDWSGNVRELKNVMERGVLVSMGSTLSVKDLGLEDSVKGTLEGATINENKAFIPPEGIDFNSIQLEFERRYFEEALKMADGNESKAAKFLGMNHHTFRYRKKKIFTS